jgi:hypothetical protein
MPERPINPLSKDEIQREGEAMQAVYGDRLLPEAETKGVEP